MELQNILLLAAFGYLGFFCLFFSSLGVLLDFTKVKSILTRPIALGIGIFSNILLLPLLSYGSGWALFPDEIDIRFGQLLVGISTAGVASICWIVIFGGNIDLAVTTNVINTGLTYASVPLWVNTIGRTIYYNEENSIPFGYLIFESILLVFGYGLGILMRSKCSVTPEFATIVVKSCSVTYLISCLSIGIYNSYDVLLYLPKELQLKTVLAGFILPTLGYFITWLIATVFKLEQRDRMTVALGASNISLMMSWVLHFSLLHSEVAMVYVIYTAIVIMTPIPLAIHYLLYKIKERLVKS